MKKENRKESLDISPPPHTSLCLIYIIGFHPQAPEFKQMV